MTVQKYLKLEISNSSFKYLRTVKQKNKKTKFVAPFLGESTARQSAYVFIEPLTGMTEKTILIRVSLPFSSWVFFFFQNQQRIMQLLHSTFEMGIKIKVMHRYFILLHIRYTLYAYRHR